ncbi:unnamed protein product [Peniophora sp. CBMAI 1063]|nr:unnamed protein product [Peniophora sp. CBMAI 1063]
MAVAHERPFGALSAFDFTFDLGSSAGPRPSNRASNPFFPGSVFEGVAPPSSRRTSLPPLVNRNTEPESSSNAPSVRPPVPSSQDDLTERVARLVNEHLASALSALAEDRNSLERGLVNHFGTRIEMLRASAAENCDKKRRDAESGVQQRFKVNENRIESLSNDLREVNNARGGLYLKTQAEGLQQRLRSEINKETQRAKDDAASIRSTVAEALTRLSKMEKAHAELKTQHTQLEHQHAGLITQLCATTANHNSAIKSLKADLDCAQKEVKALRSTALLHENMLMGTKASITESTKSADAAMRKAKGLEVHVQRWLDEETRKWLDEEARKAREAEEKRKREEEQRRVEEQRKKAEAEALRKAQAEAEERRRKAEAEAARLREQAKKAEDEARKRAQEQSQREANAERERRKEEQARREKEKQEWAKREKERQERKRGEHDILARWALYEAPLLDVLTFSTIIWPVLVQPVDLSDLTLAAIRDFLFSKAHSKDKDNKQRLRDAFKRWHSDKCSTVKSRVADEEKPLIEEAFHTISVHLNDLNAQFAKTESATNR